MAFVSYENQYPDEKNYDTRFDFRDSEEPICTIDIDPESSKFKHVYVGFYSIYGL